MADISIGMNVKLGIGIDMNLGYRYRYGYGSSAGYRYQGIGGTLHFNKNLLCQFQLNHASLSSHSSWFGTSFELSGV